MDPAVKKIWVDALRSGEYEQATHYLRTGDGYCCLGVLSDKCPTIDWRATTGTEMQLVASGAQYSIDGATHQLPDSVVRWAGLDCENPTIRISCLGHVPGDDYCECEDGTKERLLSQLNDDRTSFAEIADLIDEQL